MDNKTLTPEKKKRKINVIDIIFIVIIVAAIAAVGWKLAGDASKKTSAVKFTVVLHSDEMPADALKGLNVGDTVLDETEKLFGTIVSIAPADARIHGTSSDGRDVLSSKEDYISLALTLEVTAVKGEHFISLNGKKYSINTSFTAICGMSRLWLRITDITPAA